MSDLAAKCESIDAELDQWLARLSNTEVALDESDGTEINWLATVVEDLQRQYESIEPDRHFGSSLADLYESPLSSRTDGLGPVLERLGRRATAARDLVWLRIAHTESAAVIANDRVERGHGGLIRGELIRADMVYVDGAGIAAPRVSAPPTRSGDRWRIVAEVVSALGALLVVFVLYAVFATGLQAARSQRTLERDFSAQLLATAAAVDEDAVAVQESGVLGGSPPPAAEGDVIGTGDAPADEGPEADGESSILDPIAQGEPVAILSLPTVGSRQIVVEGTRANELAGGPGHLRSTPLPGRAGNSVIFGRRTTHGGPFAELDDLRPGDPLDVTTTDGVFRYVVQRVIRVGAGEADPIGATFTNRLTLITSDEVYSTGGRLVAIGLLEGAPVPTPTTDDGRSRALPPVNPDELGTKRTGTSWALALMWSQILLLVYLGARWLYRHWLPWSTWLVSAPAIVLVAFQWLDSLTRLLPSTL